jgi:hypothetical protein
MANIAAVLKELQQERNRLDQAIAALSSLAGTGSASGGAGSGRRPLSPAARARIAAAQRARWAKVKTKGKTGSGAGKRVMSAAARRKIAAAQRARWAERKSQQKKAA